MSVKQFGPRSGLTKLFAADDKELAALTFLSKILVSRSLIYTFYRTILTAGYFLFILT